MIVFLITFGLALLYIRLLGAELTGAQAMSCQALVRPLVVLILLVAASAFPFYWAVVSSFTPGSPAVPGPVA